jgi:hypothetical protein
MINRIQLRETLAWTAVLLAFILFSATIAFAQEQSVKVTNENGKVHIETKSVHNGQTVTRDTTFNADDNTDVDKIIDDFAGMKDKGGKKQLSISSKNDKGKQKKVIIDMDIPELSEADQQKIHEDISRSMEDLQRGLHDMKKSLQNMDIHIDNDLDNMDFSFNFEMPDIHGDDEIDSLRDKNHVIIVGDENEKAPVLEKVITKNGKQVFVYKRDRPEPKADMNAEWIEDFKVYPNPSSGKFTVKFHVPSKTDLKITVTDNKVKSVYSDSVKSFSGNYSKEINLSDAAKGTYFINISNDDNSFSKKIVIE